MVDGKKTFHGVAFFLVSFFVWLPGAIVGTFLSALLAYSYNGGYEQAEVGGIIILLWLLWMLLPFFYVLYHFFGKTPRCPICNAKLGKKETIVPSLPSPPPPPPFSQTIPPPPPPQPPPGIKTELEAKQKAQTIVTYKCPKCGGPLTATKDNNAWWCSNCNNWVQITFYNTNLTSLIVNPMEPKNKTQLTVEKPSQVVKRDNKETQSSLIQTLFNDFIKLNGKEFDCYSMDINKEKEATFEIDVVNGEDINFYILSPEEFLIWKAGKLKVSAYISRPRVKREVIKWIPPVPGEYDILFDNTYSSINNTCKVKITSEPIGT